MELLKSLPSIIQDFRKSGDLIYRVACGFAGVGVIASVAAGRPPSELAGDVAASFHMAVVSDWLRSGLPPALSTRNDVAGIALFGAACIIVACMLVVPVIRAQKDSCPMAVQARGLVSSRAAATTWLVMVFSAQLTHPDRTWILSIPLVVLLLALVVLFVQLLVCWRRLRSMRAVIATPIDLEERLWGKFDCLVLMTLAGLAFAVLLPIVATVTWLIDVESDRLRAVKAQALSISYPALADGAMSIPANEVRTGMS